MNHRSKHYTTTQNITLTEIKSYIDGINMKYKELFEL